MTFYETLKNTYGENQPIFLSEIKMEGMSENSIRQKIKKLTDTGALKRFDSGIYFIPGQSIFHSGGQLSREQVVEKRYLRENEKTCGYISGLMFANQLGITTQVPMTYEVVTNKATTEYREISLAKSRLIIRKPKTPITESNYKALQFLDLMKDLDSFAEISGEALTNCLQQYMKKALLPFSALEPFLRYYPDKIYRNLYEAKLLNGVSA